jgi:hypothetical protein
MDLPKGHYGYWKQLASGHISVLYNGTEGVHVVMSGQGCG